MVKPSYRTDSLCMYHKGYQQALEDFAIAKRCCEAQIANLLTQLKTYSNLRQMASESRSDCLYLLSFHVY